MRIGGTLRRMHGSRRMNFDSIGVPLPSFLSSPLSECSKVDPTIRRYRRSDTHYTGGSWSWVTVEE